MLKSLSRARIIHAHARARQLCKSWQILNTPSHIMSGSTREIIIVNEFKQSLFLTYRPRDLELRSSLVFSHLCMVQACFEYIFERDTILCDYRSTRNAFDTHCTLWVKSKWSCRNPAKRRADSKRLKVKRDPGKC